MSTTNIQVYRLLSDGTIVQTQEGYNLSLRKANAQYEQNGQFYITVLVIGFPKTSEGSKTREIHVICGGDEVVYPKHVMCVGSGGCFIEIPLDARWMKDAVQVYFV